MKNSFHFLFVALLGSLFMLFINVGSASANDLLFVNPATVMDYLIDNGYMTESVKNIIMSDSNYTDLLNLYNDRQYFACVINNNAIYFCFSVDRYNNIIFGRKSPSTDNTLYKSLTFKNSQFNVQGTANSTIKAFSLNNGSYTGNWTGVPLSSNSDLPDFIYSDLPIHIIGTDIFVDSSPAEWPDSGLLKVPKFELQNNIAGSYSVLQITLGDFEDVDYSKIENITLENDSVGFLNLGSGLFVRNNRLFVQTRYLKFNQDYHLQIEYNYDTGEGFLYNGVFRISSSDGTSGDVDFTNQDVTNNIINNQEKTTQDVINSLTAPADVSGELSKYLSGDTILGEIGFNSIEIDSRMMEIDDFYTSLAQEIRQLLLQDADYTVTFNWAGTNITLNSRDFTTPESIVKDFSRGFLTFVSIMLFFKYIVGLIHRIQEGNFNGIVHHASVNDDSILL